MEVALSSAPRTPRLAAVHALAAGIDFDRYFRWRRSREGDPFYVVFPGVGAALFTGTPDGAREVFRAPVDLLEPPRPNPIEPLVGAASLILTAGERHRRDRALLAPAFHRGRIRAYGELVRDAVVDEISGDAAGSAAWRPGATVDARAAARAVTLRVILGVLFGTDDAERHTHYTAAVSEFLDAYSGPLLLIPALRHGAFGATPWDRFRTARERVDRLIRADIARRRATGRPGGTDILAGLLNVRDEDGEALSDDDLCDQLRTLVVAGHETTATSVVWALYHLHRAPRVLARLRAEVLEAGTDADPTALATLPYLDAVCQETLRLHPPVPIVLRRVGAPFTLRGVTVAAGGVMGVALPLLHSEPTVWPDPGRFHPERFLERGFGPFEYAPFGGGHRRCVGAALAEYEMRIVLATILSRVRLALTPRHRTGRTPLSVPHNIATGPRSAIRFVVLP